MNLQEKPLQNNLRENNEQLLDHFKLIYDQEKNGKEISANMTREAYKVVKKILAENGKFCANAGEAYNSYRGDLIVRREDPAKIINLITRGAPIVVDFDQDVATKNAPTYANCAIYNNNDTNASGLENAFSEGFGRLAGITMVVGFKPNEDFKIEEVKAREKNIHGIDRPSVRAGKGRIRPEDLQFVSIRVPGDLMPPEEISEDEAGIWEEYEEKLDRYEAQKDIPGAKKAKAPDKPQFFRGFAPKRKEDAGFGHPL